MVTSTPWPEEETLIPDLLVKKPEARAVLDRYGLRGCGGPQGPSESLRFFARAHGVPLDRLLSEIRSVARPAVPLVQIGQPPPAPSIGDTIYRSFFRAGIAVVLSLGAVWGAYLLLRIGLSGSFTAAGLHEVNAHGHAQIFGWVGLFVMGFAYQAFPRFKHTTLAYPRVALATFWMMLAGLVVRSICQPLGTSLAVAWWAAVGASVLEVVAIALFAAIIATTWKRSGKPLAFYDYYIASALVWFVIQGLWESMYLTATLSATGKDLVALAATWQAPLRDAQIHGFAMLMILGVSQRLFHHFYELPQPNQRLSLAVLPVLNLAIVGEIVGLVLMRTAGHGWAALWYLSVVTLTVATAVLVTNWRIYSHAPDGDRSLKFLRAAYVWLFVSLGMLALLPAYQARLLPWLAPESAAATLGFSHAYYGATRHAITVGFISLMIVGVSAKVVPTLNGVDGRRLTLLWGPLLLINAGCALRVIGQTLTDFVPQAFPLAGVSGMLEVAGLALWGAHLWSIMAGRPRFRSAPARAVSPPTNDSRITADFTVAQVLDHHPELLEVFLQFGFTALTQPAMRVSMARVVTLGQACRRMGIDQEQFLHALNDRREQSADATAAETHCTSDRCASSGCC